MMMMMMMGGIGLSCRKRLGIVSELVLAGIFKQKGTTTTTTRFCCKNEIVHEIFSKYISVL